LTGYALGDIPAQIWRGGERGRGEMVKGERVKGERGNDIQ